MGRAGTNVKLAGPTWCLEPAWSGMKVAEEGPASSPEYCDLQRDLEGKEPWKGQGKVEPKERKWRGLRVRGAESLWATPEGSKKNILELSSNNGGFLKSLGREFPVAEGKHLRGSLCIHPPQRPLPLGRPAGQASWILSAAPTGCLVRKGSRAQVLRTRKGAA